MSHALHVGFTPVWVDPARQFIKNAPEILDLEELVCAFGRAIAAERAAGHMCCIVEEDGSLSPAFGDAPMLADQAGQPAIEAIEISAPDGSPLLLLLALRAPSDRRQLSRLRLAANIYATHAITLLDAREDAPVDGLTLIERRCLSLTLAGWSYLDIGEALDRSAPAVGVHVKRAMAKLGAASVAEAIALAAARGMIK